MNEQEGKPVMNDHDRIQKITDDSFRLGNRVRQEGVDRCPCGCKYWENDRCVDCGERLPDEACPDHFVGAETLGCQECGWNGAMRRFGCTVVTGDGSVCGKPAVQSFVSKRGDRLDHECAEHALPVGGSR